MNSDSAIEHQRRRLFVAQLLSFAGLFIALGLIVFVMYERSVYRDVDQTLVQQKRKSLSNTQTMTMGRNPLRNGKPTNNEPNPMRTTLLVFNSKGKITNQAQIGMDAYATYNT
ncbi:hypothetical protein [Lacticaseibacillus manihotivorans]|uniref:hypothetical protein n=1 Tax=Lacticaseibacillus manihotivorans TaxID=88233 RepID=UPI000AE2E355|nr:hypothetical protein [Lacticaseibacillus manihotivorans]